MIIIGQTCEVYKDDKYPSLKDLINKPIKEKEKILKYMKKCTVTSASPAVITDLINPEIRFNELLCMTDGKYGWRSDVIYYVEKYDMELPEEFIEHALNEIKKNGLISRDLLQRKRDLENKRI
jgi:hypothetical protein